MKRVLAAILLICGSVVASAEELSFEQVMATFTDPVELRVTEGRIEALDLIDRTGTIGGHRYHFGPSTLSTPLQVKLLGRNFGSLELLNIGMDVRVSYFVSPSEHRVAIELIQIEQALEH